MENKFKIGDKVKDSDGDVGIIIDIYEKENESNQIKLKYIDENRTIEGFCNECDLVIDEEEYYLCFVDDGKCWFTDNWKKTWGDDWDDEPYEFNAGTPYDNYSVLIKANESPYKQVYERKPIKYKTCIVEFPNIWVYEPKQKEKNIQ